MDTDSLVKDIEKDIEEKLEDIYLKYQEKLYIRDGDIIPDMSIEQDKLITELARSIAEVLIFEMGMGVKEIRNELFHSIYKGR